MSIETLRSFLLACTVINYAILMVWFLAFMMAHDTLHRLHSRWFRLSADPLRGHGHLQDRHPAAEPSAISRAADDGVRRALPFKFDDEHLATQKAYGVIRTLSWGR
jgi:hypothetical protein